MGEITIHAVCGYLGAGKTTYSARLAAETGAVRLSPDEWMVRLHGINPPAESFDRHFAALMELIWEQAETLVSRGVSVILDFGFWTRKDRDRARALGAQHGATVKLYHLTCPEELMRKRVSDRNEKLGESSALYIDTEAFEAFKSRVEPYGEDEEFDVVYTGDPM